MLMWFLSNHCILSLVLNVCNQEKNTVVLMASLLPLNGHIASAFDSTHLELSAHAYFMVVFQSRQDIKILKVDFYEVITNELCLFILSHY